MKRLFLIFLFLLIACPAWGATYSIGTGKTYTTFTALAAAVTLSAGDIVDGGGETFSETWTINGSGVSGNVITLQNAIITGGINGNSKDYLRITKIQSGGEVTLSGTYNQIDYFISHYSKGNGITVTGANNTIYNVVINGSTGKGIDAQESCTIKNTSIRNTNDANLYIKAGKTVTGESNRFQDPTYVGTGTYTDAGNPWAARTDKNILSFDKTIFSEWSAENPSYHNNIIGYSYHDVGTTLFSDAFPEADGAAANWTPKVGTFAVASNVYKTTNHPTFTLSIPTIDYSYLTDYLYTVTVTRLGEIDAYGYALIYFRITLSGNNATGYALLYRQNGTAQLYTVVNGLPTTLLGTISGLSKDNSAHIIRIELSGYKISIWIDKEVTEAADLVKYNTTYSSGGVGIGSHQWDSSFDDVSIVPYITVTPSPKVVYDGTSSISLKNLYTAESTSVTVITPSGTTYTKSAPTGCAGNTTCSLTFPTDFTGLSIAEKGIYKILVTNGTAISHSFINVRQKPDYTFVQITDTHVGMHASAVTYLDSIISDINNEKYTPLPDFVIHTGDITDGGTVAQLSAAKASMDNLTIPYYVIGDGHDWLAESGNERGHYFVNAFGLASCAYNFSLGNNIFVGITAAPYCDSMNVCANFNAYLSSVISANTTKKLFLFSHRSNGDVRDSGGANNFYWACSGSTLSANSNSIANFGGHSHVNGNIVSGGVLYQHTDSLVNNDEYRYVEIYPDRIESFMIPRTGSDPTFSRANWSGSTDTTHTATYYSFGLPEERQFIFDYSTRTINPLNYHLQAGSPAVNKGVNVGLTTDFEGNAIKGNPEIGVYERTTYVPWR